MRKEIHTLFFVTGFVVLSIIMRLMSVQFHWYHFAPFVGLGLFCGASFNNRTYAYFLPLAALFISDLCLELFTTTPGFYGISQIVNYAALILITYLGSGIATKKWWYIAGITLSASLLFFILSNFGTWLQGYYGYSFTGLVNCYLMAIPFYKSELSTTFFIHSICGDLFFSGLLFGGYRLVQNYFIPRWAVNQ